MKHLDISYFIQTKMAANKNVENSNNLKIGV